MLDPSVDQDTPAEKESLSEPIALDLCAAMVAAIVVVVIAIRLGGFSFFAPWLIVTPIVMFVVGLIRGKNQGQVLLRAIGIGAFLLLLLLFLDHDPMTLWVGILIIVAPTLGGMAIRGWRIRSRLAQHARDA